jgi:hypothetical protein
MTTKRLILASITLFAAAACLRADPAPVPTVKDFFYVYASKSRHEINCVIRTMAAGVSDSCRPPFRTHGGHPFGDGGHPLWRR